MLDDEIEIDPCDDFMKNYAKDEHCYKMLLKHNYISKITNTNDIENCLQMEHSYSRDWRPMEGAQVMTTRTIMVHRPPQCPSCHVPASDEIRVDIGDPYNPPIPSYNEDQAKISMDECEKVALAVRKGQLDNEDWEMSINKNVWTPQQRKLFDRIAKILDLDHLARLAHKDRQHEPVHRRTIIDKSVSRIRQAFANIAWDARLTQWLHGLLMEQLPPNYLGAYMDILQTLKAKIPSLVDKMMFGRPLNINQELLGPVLKTPWEPNVPHKARKLPGQAILIIAPSQPITTTTPSPRIQRWYTLLSTMANVVPVQMNSMETLMQKQTLASITEQMVAVCRAKVQEVRNENPNRSIVLIGFNAGASVALQVALVEQVSSVICIGFAFNTFNGVRGTPDDRILDITIPVLFILGQNSARSSQEEIESLREKMQAQTSLVVVGSADDALRVSKNKRRIEGVTQAMVDNMVMDEISEFASTCILNPPGPRDIVNENARVANGTGNVRTNQSTTNKKRKNSNTVVDGETVSVKTKKDKVQDNKVTGHVPRKVGRPRIRPPSPKRPKLATKLLKQPSPDALNMAIQSILPSNTQQPAKPKEILNPTATAKHVTPQIISNYQIVTNPTKITTTTIQPSTSIQKNYVTPTIKSTATKNPLSALTFGQKSVQKIKLMSSSQLAPTKQQTIGTVANNTNNTSTITKQFIIKPANQTKLNVGTTSQTIRAQQPTNKMFTVKTIPASAISNVNTIKSQQTTNTIVTQPSTSLTKSIHSVTNNTNNNSNSTLNISPPKFTIMKQNLSSPIVKITPISMSSSSSSPQPSSSITTTSISPIKTNNVPDLSTTNIFDIPIVFADNDGNIQDSTSLTTTNNISTASVPIVVSSSAIDRNVSQLVQNRNIVINSITVPNRGPIAGTNKVMFINRNQTKPTIPNILSRTVPPLKYTKVMVNNSNINLNKSTFQTITTTSTPTMSSTSMKPTIKLSTLSGGTGKFEILSNSLIKGPTNLATSILINSSGNLVPSTATTTTTIAGVSSQIGKFQPIVINVDSDKTTIKNMINVVAKQQQQPQLSTPTATTTTTTIRKPNTIVIKPGGLKPITTLNSNLLNKSVTVRKVYNIVPHRLGQLVTAAPNTSQTMSGQIQSRTTNIISTQANNISTKTDSTITLSQQ